MSTTTKRWNAAKEGKILAALFENNKADPRYTKATDIDPFKDMHDDSKDFTLQQFRDNYKTTATNWMAGEAVGGTRLQSLNREFKETDDVISVGIVATTQPVHDVLGYQVGLHQQVVWWEGHTL